MLAYADVEGFVTDALTADGYDPLPLITPGPGSDQTVQDESPDSIVILTLSGGPGLDMEQIFDRAAVQVRAIGPQEDYNAAEKLAQDIDRAMVAVDSSKSINGKWTLSIVRTGGPPSLLVSDDGDRYHFTCNYIWEVVY